jgi:alpha-amylase
MKSMKKQPAKSIRKSAAQPSKNLCFYFEVHQPYRLGRRRVFDVGTGGDYFEGPPTYENKAVFEKVARKCYLPANRTILELLNNHPEFRVSYSLSGVFMEQCLEFGAIGKEVLESFQAIFKTGQAEILSETYYHSLSWLYSKDEFAQQIRKHAKLVKKLFGKTPRVFRNTELIYNNEIAEFVREMGYRGVLAEGWDPVLGWRSPNHLYLPPKTDLHPEDRKIARANRITGRSKGQAAPRPIGLLMKNYKLSDDIAFRFSDRNWSEWPLTTDKYVEWLKNTPGETINLFMDYETFGEHQWEDTGIFEFLRYLPVACQRAGIGFRTPSETLRALKPVGEADIPHLMSWADMERDLSAWLSNPLQESALSRIFSMESEIKSQLDHLDSLAREQMIHTWRKLQTSDHFYYMCTKYWSDGDVHAYFSPFESPYDAYITYMNTLADFEHLLENSVVKK